MAETEEKSPENLKFDFIKSEQFRVIHADGVLGGVTPRLKIFMSIWSERPPIPQRVVHSINADGTMGAEIADQRVIRDSDVVREVEAGVVMDIGLARAVVLWLQDKIKTAEEIVAQHREEIEHD